MYIYRPEVSANKFIKKYNIFEDNQKRDCIRIFSESVKERDVDKNLLKIIVENNKFSIYRRYNILKNHIKWKTRKKLVLMYGRKNSKSYLDELKKKQRENIPSRKEFWINRGLSEEEAIAKISSIQRKNFTEEHKNKLKEALNDPNVKEKIKRTKEIRNTLEFHIQEHGEEMGNYLFLKKKEIKANILRGITQKIKLQGKTRERSIRCVEYWMKRGYSILEAIEKVSDVQKRDKEYFTNKYGEKEGVRKWRNKIDSWRFSFDTNNDKEEVNKKRSINSHCGTYNTKNVVRYNIDRLNFYLLHIIDYDNDSTEIIKFGLTKQNHITKRWKMNDNFSLLLFYDFDAMTAVKLETELNKTFRGSYLPKSIKTQECFVANKENILLFEEIFKKHTGEKYQWN